MPDPAFILLARHGAKADDPFTKDSELPLSDKGCKEIEEIAIALANEILVPTNGEIKIGEIWHATTAHAQQTAAIFRQVLDYHRVASVKLHPCVELNPERFRAEKRTTFYEDFAAHLRRRVRSQESAGSNAILIAGHSPQLEWIAETLTGASVAIARSELACISLTRRRYIRWTMSWPPLRLARQFLWTLAPTDNVAKRQILAKIRSKMETAKLLGALMTAVMGWILGSFLDPDKLSALRWENACAYRCLCMSALCFFVAILLYLATMYAYDSLLMPSAFWTSAAGRKPPKWLPCRPPSSDTRVLFHNMMHVWYWLFTPATALVILGLLLLAEAVLRPTPTVWWVAPAIAIVLLIVMLKKGWPRHGAQD